MEDQGTVEEAAKSTKKNGTATFVTFVGWAIILIGAIAGLAIGQESTEPYTYSGIELTRSVPGSTAMGFAVFFSSVISGTLFIALAEIINLLDKPQPKTEEL